MLRVPEKIFSNEWDKHKENIKMQIVSCQYFSRGGRIRQGLQKKQQKKPVQTQILLLVTTNMLTLLISKTAAK